MLLSVCAEILVIQTSSERDRYIYILSIYLYLINMTEQNFVFCTVIGDGSWDVHIEGCQDIKRGLELGKHPRNVSIGGKKITRIYGDTITVSADNVEDAISEEVAELNSDFGENAWSAEYFNIMPCCKKVK